MQRTKHTVVQVTGIAAMAAILSCITFMQAHAVTRKVSISATPAILDTGGKPGERTVVSFTLKNDGNVILPIQVSPRNAQARNGQSSEAVQAMSAKSWVAIGKPDMVLGLGEERNVEITVSIPKDASPGGHYVDLVVRSLQLEGNEEFIATQPELVVQMLLSVPGDVRENLKTALSGPTTIVTARSADKKLIFDITNEGNIHILFQPQLRIRSDDRVFDSLSTNSSIVLPKETSKTVFSLPANMPAGIYHAEMRATYGLPSKEIVGQSVRIIILPFSPFILALLPVSVGAFFAYKKRHRIISAVKIIAKGE